MKCVKVDANSKMNDPKLTALCMKCFHKNGRKNGKQKCLPKTDVL